MTAEIHGVPPPERTYTPHMDEIIESTQKQVSEALEPCGEECEVCGSEMYGLHCKLICPNCGYRRDCSDP